MLVANPRPLNNGFTFLLFYTYTKVPDIETSVFNGVISHCCTTKGLAGQDFLTFMMDVLAAGTRAYTRLFIKFSRTLNPRPGSFWPQPEIYWSQIKDQIKAATFFAES